MINDNSQTWAEDAGDYELGQYRESEIRYDAQQLEGFSESEKQTIFAKVMEGLQAETGQVGRFEVADQEMQVAQERSRLQALTDAQNEEYRATEASRRENQISNAGVQMLNELVAGGMDEQEATNQVIQQMSQWATDPNFMGLRQDAGEWIPKEPVAVGTVEDAGMKASQPAGAVPLDAAGIRQAFLQQVGTRGEQAAAIKEPAAVEWVTNAISRLRPTDNPERDLLNVNTSIAAELQKGGAQNPLWYNFTLPKRQGIAIENVLSYIEMSQPDRIDRNQILQDFETGEAFKFIMELREAEEKASKKDRPEIRDKQEATLNEYIDRTAQKWNVPRKIIDFILFPEQYEIGIGKK
jgi:hypothetical protein